MCWGLCVVDVVWASECAGVCVLSVVCVAVCMPSCGVLFVVCSRLQCVMRRNSVSSGALLHLLRRCMGQGPPLN